jgi:hypothetical protein
MTEQQILDSIVIPSMRTATANLPGLDAQTLTIDTPLYGVDHAVLDSMNLVSFVFLVEDEIKKVTGKEIKITAQDVLNPEKNPFGNPKALALFLKDKL